MIKPYECTQCGSTDFADAGGSRVRCSFCGSLFAVLTGDPKLTINKGAKVVFGKNANVEIRGSVQIQDGADVDIQGKVTVLKDGKKQEFKLKLIRE
ncbi:MAG: hypothetical protein FD146_754 [Anaerolineaceae bacterium]|nr:MAG: hypothetical protein FD146_754 [Anaerolineaceae bacterium]